MGEALIIAAIAAYAPALINAVEGVAALPVIKMDRATFEALSDYSCSVPTGTTVGKVWRRRLPYRHRPGGNVWTIGSYQEHPTDPTLVRIVWWRAELKD